MGSKPERHSIGGWRSCLCEAARTHRIKRRSARARWLQLHMRAAPSKISSLMASPVAARSACPRRCASPRPHRQLPAGADKGEAVLVWRKQPARLYRRCGKEPRRNLRHSASAALARPHRGNIGGSTGSGPVFKIAHAHIVPSGRENSSGVRISPLASRYSRNSASAGMASPVSNNKL